MKSRGYCTLNENGLFEVNYTLEDTLLSKLFNLKREFRFTCSYLYKFNYKLYTGCYDKFIWKDEEGRRTTDKQHLRKNKQPSDTFCLGRRVFTRPTTKVRGKHYG